jgi:hypothetical protein
MKYRGYKKKKGWYKKNIKKGYIAPLKKKFESEE